MDVSGHERYHNLTSLYYRRAQGAMVVYDITHPVIIYLSIYCEYLKNVNWSYLYSIGIGTLEFRVR